MKHAGSDAIASLEPLLVELRRFDELREEKAGVFYRKSRAFLHFHEDPKGLFVDVRLAGDFSRFPVNTVRQRRDLLARVGRALASPPG